MRTCFNFVILYYFVKCTCQDVSLRFENNSQHSFCSFFNNRAPQSQPTLTNCTWFRKNSCCLQHEIDVSFSRVKPLIGATENCQKYTNYLMCYICSPDQNKFYKKERLTVCEPFCDLLYEFCKFAVLKGNQIRQLYGSGRDFCLSRRFLVGHTTNCFSVPHIPKLAKSDGNVSELCSRIHLLILLAFISCNVAASSQFENKKLYKGCFFEKLSFPNILLFVMLLLTHYVKHCQGHIISYDEISILGKSVSSFIDEYTKSSIMYPSYEESVASSSMKSVKDSVIFRDIKNHLSSFFTLRKATVREIAKSVATYHEKEVHNHSSDEPLFVRRLDSDEADEDYYLPFEEILNNDDPYVERSFFASRGGEFFSHPDKIVKHFEPRAQPWYLGVKEAPSNVILILDSSYIQDINRFKRSRDVALVLLKSLAQHQRVSVISSSSLTWDSSGKVHNASANVLGCVRNRLIRATPGNVEMFIESVKNIKPLGGSDHSGAFNKAFNLLKRQQTSHQKYLECRSVILFVTDGERDEHLRCSPGYHQYTEGNARIYQQGEICQHDTYRLLINIQRLQRSLPGAKANIFTFLTSHGRRSDISFCGKLACQNNGAFSRIYEDNDLFSQMHPYFDYIRNREYSYEPIITGPYKSLIDGQLVITFSAPVITQGSNSILGVVGTDVLFSTLENLLEEHHEYLYLVNLVDGSAIIHPLIQKSYEDSKEWKDIPLLNLEMEDSDHSVEFPEVIRRMMQRINGHVIVKTNATEGFEVEEGRALWKAIPSIVHLFSDIPGTQFGFGIKAILSNDQDHAYFSKVNKNANLHTMGSGSKHYHHSLFASALVPVNILLELNITRHHISYPGIPVSFQHSSIVLTPPAFCKSSFVHLTSHGRLLDIQRYINTTREGTKYRDIEDGKIDAVSTDDCLITERARQDIIMTLPLEKNWKDVHMISNSVKSLYVATMNGVIRHYPGLSVPEGLIHHPLRYPWFVRAMLNPGKIVLTNNRAPFSGAQNVITMSRLVSQSHKFVLVADLLKDELHQKFLHVLGTDVCCPHSRNTSCSARCYLISDQGEIVMSLSDGLDRSRSRNLYEQFPFIYEILAKYNLLAFAKVSDLRKNCSSFRNQLEDSQPSRACMAVKMEFKIKSGNLNKMGGTFGRAFDSTSADSCHKGVFYISSINSTNLFFLTLINYSDDKHSELCKQKILKLQQAFGIQLNLICPDHDHYYISRTNSTTCPKKRFISLYCRYSSASHEEFGTLTFIISIFYTLSICHLISDDDF